MDNKINTFTTRHDFFKGWLNGWSISVKKRTDLLKTTTLKVLDNLRIGMFWDHLWHTGTSPLQQELQRASVNAHNHNGLTESSIRDAWPWRRLEEWCLKHDVWSKEWVGCVRGDRKDRRQNTHSLSRGPEAFWVYLIGATPQSPVSQGVGYEERRRRGRGIRMEGTTLVIGSLATVGWVEVINRNCPCSREPLMALNLHQVWTGGQKRKSQEQRQPASYYTADLHLNSAVDSLSHTHSGWVSTGDSKDSRPQHPACQFHCSAPFRFISNALHFRPFHSALPPTSYNFGLSTLSRHRTKFQPLNSISIWPQPACLPSSFPQHKDVAVQAWSINGAPHIFISLGQLLHRLKIHTYQAQHWGEAKSPRRAVQHNEHRDWN